MASQMNETDGFPYKTPTADFIRMISERYCLLTETHRFLGQEDGEYPQASFSNAYCLTADKDGDVRVGFYYSASPFPPTTIDNPILEVASIRVQRTTDNVFRGVYIKVKKNKIVQVQVFRKDASEEAASNLEGMIKPESDMGKILEHINQYLFDEQDT